MSAKAWACTAALKPSHSLSARGATVLLAGDNLAVVRFAAATGGLRRAAMALPIQQQLNNCHCQHLDFSYLAVRRAHKKAVDALATDAIRELAFRMCQGTAGQKSL